MTELSDSDLRRVVQYMAQRGWLAPCKPTCTADPEDKAYHEGTGTENGVAMLAVICDSCGSVTRGAVSYFQDMANKIPPDPLVN